MCAHARANQSPIWVCSWAQRKVCIYTDKATHSSSMSNNTTPARPALCARAQPQSSRHPATCPPALTPAIELSLSSPVTCHPRTDGDQSVRSARMREQAIMLGYVSSTLSYRQAAHNCCCGAYSEMLRDVEKLHDDSELVKERPKKRRMMLWLGRAHRSKKRTLTTIQG